MTFYTRQAMPTFATEGPGQNVYVHNSSASSSIREVLSEVFVACPCEITWDGLQQVGVGKRVDLG